jgi:hypothetical protein
MSPPWRIGVTRERQAAPATAGFTLQRTRAAAGDSSRGQRLGQQPGAAAWGSRLGQQRSASALDRGAGARHGRVMVAHSPAPDARDAALRAFATARLGHEFADLGLLREALTHGSARTGGRSYQRLEFLGDRVLGCIVATWLFNDHDEPEGKLSSRKWRAAGMWPS